MPSPFPGMDPFIEGQEWEDFHPTFVVLMREALAAALTPRYLVRVERRVYVESASEGTERVVRPDVVVLQPPPVEARSEPRTGGSAATIAVPVIVNLPMPELQRQSFLTVRERETLRVVSVIELLSPVNKRARGEGRREYLQKRREVLDSDANLIELDLLRGGARLPTEEPLPPADYYALVARRGERPRAEVYSWSLRQSLPRVPIPLAEGDFDFALDLQAVFDAVYDRAVYRYALDYGRPIEPTLGDQDAAWVNGILSVLPDIASGPSTAGST